MANIGAEVGQKMRSAIKAKLLELNCYVDDELPDYVMVMVANKRSKSQMKEDLHLFLAAKTATFVDWLHIVLKKLKEVTVTNPDVYKKAAKRKSDEVPNLNVKKEKKDKKLEKVKKTEPPDEFKSLTDEFKSLTDDLPINANNLAERRKIVVMKENKSNNAEQRVINDDFDIPLLSEVNMSSEQELEDIEKKIKSVKSRLGLLVESEEEDDEDYLNLKAEPDELFYEQRQETAKETEVNAEEVMKKQHTRITYNNEAQSQNKKKKSVLERLGRKQSDHFPERVSKRGKIDLSGFAPNNAKPKESVLSRLGVMSKVSIPEKQPEEPEEPLTTREVPSVIKIKPRIIPTDAPQANKNLLLKAMAEAQRSIAQAPKVGSGKPDALYTKNYKEKLNEDRSNNKKATEHKKKEPQRQVTEENTEYVPTPTRQVQEPPKCVPGSDGESEDNSVRIRQQFIVTLDGIQKTKFKDLSADESPPKVPISARLDKRRSPSPIIFDKVSTNIKNKSNIPDKLPVIHAASFVKNKERCKYWPGCRQGDKCEFVHPATNCEKFPHCKFGDKCLFIHPSCKFGSSCTRKDCPYSHASVPSRPAPVKIPTSQQVCKYFPNCMNPTCIFYHPKPCKFGKYCKNQAECTFSHSFILSKNNLTWKSK